MRVEHIISISSLALFNPSPILLLQSASAIISDNESDALNIYVSSLQNAGPLDSA